MRNSRILLGSAFQMNKDTENNRERPLNESSLYFSEKHVICAETAHFDAHAISRMRQHKDTRALFISIDVTLSCAFALYLLLFANASATFLYASFTLMLVFNGYAFYALRQFGKQLKTKNVANSFADRSLRVWSRMRVLICVFEWLLYFLFLWLVGPCSSITQWIFFFICLLPIAIAYYGLELVEIDAGIDIGTLKMSRVVARVAYYAHRTDDSVLSIQNIAPPSRNTQKEQ